MAALLLDIAPGDEVIVPSFTFVSTINAFVIRGAAPVFVDIRSDTLDIDEAQIERHLTAQTKAIVVVHYGGIGCEMEVIADCAARHGIPVVEDNAHGLFGRYRDRYLGTFGQLAALSFHETKNYTCGEGGALIIRDPALIERAEVIREKGTNRSRFHRGEVDKYTWVDVGSSYLPSDLLAGVLLAQLESRARVEERRRQIWEGYATALSDWADGERRQASHGAAPLRPTAPSVLSAVAVDSLTRCADRDASATRHPRRVSLFAAPSVRDGATVRRTAWRLSGHGRCERATCPPAVFYRSHRLGAS